MATEDMEWKIFNDPVHKSIRLHPFLIKIIDTPEFQRLRDLKQLGFCYKVFPSATGTRFEHSIGVCHLAWRMIEQLKKNMEGCGCGDTARNITNVDQLCVAVAGLCHDLGHGAFSHTWESFMKRIAPDSHWRHEDSSVRVFNLIWRKLDVNIKSKYGMDEDERKIICDIIIGGPSEEHAKFRDKQFLFEIVANKKSGVDVDKWDYFERDNYYLAMGTRISFQYERLILHARINAAGSIEYRDSERLNFYHMFYIRWLLYHRAYKHRVVKIIEGMFIDALIAANDDILIRGKKLSECVDDVESFMYLNDDVYHKLLNLDENHIAKQIMDRIQTRDLYKCVGYCVTSVVDISASEVENEIKRDTGLNNGEFYISIEKFDYGMGAKDPIKCIPFYGKNDDDDDYLICNTATTMTPPHFQEIKILCVCRDVSPETILKAKKAFKDWFNKSKKRLQLELNACENPNELLQLDSVACGSQNEY